MWYSLDLLIFFAWGIVELSNVYLILHNFLQYEKKKSNVKKNIISVVFFIIIIAGFSYGTSYKKSVILYVLYLPFLIKSLIILRNYFKINGKAVFIVISWCLIVSTVASNIGILINTLNFPKIYMYNFILEIAASVFFLLVFSIIIFLKRKKTINVYFCDLTYMDYILFVIIINSVSIIETAMFSSTKYSSVARTISVIAYISVGILICKSIVTVSKKNDLEEINQLLEKQVRITTEYYNDIIEKEKQTKKFRHDIRNLLTTLYTLIEENQNTKALEYIEELQNICSQVTKKFNTGNYIGDVLFTIKSRQAKQYDTSIEYEGFIPEKKITDVEMVIVLANMLDNAIEACERGEGHKKIRVKSIFRNNVWVLTISNPSEHVEIRGANEVQTRKKEGLHGFGLKNILQVAKKYNGDVNLEYSDGIFKNTITLMFLE